MENEEIQNPSLNENAAEVDNEALPRTYVLYDPEANQEEDDTADMTEEAHTDDKVSVSIHDCALSSDFDALEQLIFSGVFVDLKDVDGRTALQILCGNSSAALSSECVRCVQLLLKHGADISVLDSGMNSLLHLCVRSGNEQVLELLLKRDVTIDSNLVNAEGDTALQLSAKVSQLKCLQCLVLNARPFVPPTAAAPAGVAAVVPSPAAAPSVDAAPVVIASPRPQRSPVSAAMPTRPRPNVKALVVNAEAPLTSDHFTFNEISPFPHLSASTPSSTAAGGAGGAVGFPSPSPRSPDHSLTMSVDLLSRCESYDEVQADAAISAAAAGAMNANTIESSVEVTSPVNSNLSGSGEGGGGGLESGSEKTSLSREQKRLKLRASLQDRERKAAAASSSDSAAWMQYEQVRDQGLLEDSQHQSIEGGAVELIKQQYAENQQLTRQMRSNAAASVFSSNSGAGKDVSSTAVEAEEQQQQPSLFSEYAAPPSDWMECYTAGGDVYYYNSKTEVVQWENPHEVQEAPQPQQQQVVDEINSFNGEDTAPPASAADWDVEGNPLEESVLNQSVLDTSLQYSTNTEYPEGESGQQYYYLHSQDEEGGAASAAYTAGASTFESVFTGLEAAPAAYYPEEGAVEAGGTDVAAEGSEWVECYTEQGDLYYYNTVTEASQWENPNAPTAAYEAYDAYGGGAAVSGVAVTDYNYSAYGTDAVGVTPSAYTASQVFESAAVPAAADPAQSTTPPLPAAKRRGMATRTISVDPTHRGSASPASPVSPVVMAPDFTAPPPTAFVASSAPPLSVSHPYYLRDPAGLQITSSGLPSPIGGYGLDSPALRDYHDSRDKPMSPSEGVNNSAFATPQPHIRSGVVSIDKKGLLRQRVGSSHSIGSVVSMSSLSDQSVDVDDAASGIAGLVSPDDSRRRVPLLEPESEIMSVDESNNQSVGDDNTSTASNNTERHLEIWSRFFENAFSSGGQREAAKKEQRRKAEKSKRQSSAKAIVDKSGAVLDSNGKAVAAASSNKWPSALSDKRYRALITLAVSRSASAVDEEGGEGGAGDVDTTGIDLSILSVALLAAVTQSDLSTVEELLQSGANPNCVDDQVRSPAHHAAKSGNSEMLALLFDQGADLEMCDQVGRTPLHIAALFGREAVAEFLLSCAVDVDGPVDHSGNSPLHLSARGGHAGVVRVLLQFGASSKINNSGGMTALEIAQTMQPQTSGLVEVAAALQGRVSPRDTDRRRPSSRDKHSSSSDRAAAVPASKTVDKLSKVQSVLKGETDKNPTDDRTSRKMDLLKQQAREKLQIKDTGIGGGVSGGAAAGPNASGSSSRKSGGVGSRPSHVVNPNISNDSDEDDKAVGRAPARGGGGGATAAPQVALQQGNRKAAPAPNVGTSQQIRPVQPAGTSSATPPPLPHPSTVGSVAAPPGPSAFPPPSQRRHERFADDSASDASSGDEDERGGRNNGSNLIATSVWGVATTLIDMSLSMFNTGGGGGGNAGSAPPADSGGVKTKARTSSKSSPPAAATVKSSGLSWFSRKPSVEDENQAAIERLIGGGGLVTVAPPTDSELLHKGLGFHSTAPPDIVARELAARAGQMSGGHNGPTPLPPSEVQVAVAMARAENNMRHSPNPFDSSTATTSTSGGGLHLSTSVLSSNSMDDASSVGSPTAGRPNGYSIGASLPKGVSWRYVDVLNQK